jgi:hypothetical protein
MKSLPMSSAGSRKLPGCFKGTQVASYRVGATLAVALAGQASFQMRFDNLLVWEIHI